MFRITVKLAEDWEVEASSGEEALKKYYDGDAKRTQQYYMEVTSIEEII